MSDLAVNESSGEGGKVGGKQSCEGHLFVCQLEYKIYQSSFLNVKETNKKRNM